LEQEENIRAEREKALRFLDGVSSTLDSRPRSEQDHVEKSIREAIARVKEGAEQLERQCRELENDKKQVKHKLDKRKSELERAQKRLASMANVRMPFMDEYEALEVELGEEYKLYVQKHRNLDFLERELDLFDKVRRDIQCSAMQYTMGTSKCVPLSWSSLPMRWLRVYRLAKCPPPPPPFSLSSLSS